MNYDETIQKIIDAAKADTSLNAEWRNSANKRLKEARAFFHEAKIATFREAEPDVCTCPSGGIKRTCPVHGGEQ